ncbi:MAG: hypothetical protein IPK82_36055 [Polyangiaceae bacterium]|nr:hypothetical protein [Polyangiaceae bacterium]
MAHIVETAKSGRARCRTCGEGIAKDALRFGEEVPNAFSESGGTTFHWHHAQCAAKKKPSQLREALAVYTGDVHNREELEQLIAENELKQRPTTFPFAERSPSARAKCGECRNVIEKGALRVAVQREPDGPSLMIMPATPRYLHAACARQSLPGATADVLASIKKNSRGLTDADLAELGAALSDAHGQ